MDLYLNWRLFQLMVCLSPPAKHFVLILDETLYELTDTELQRHF